MADISPGAGPFDQERALVEVLAQDGDGVGHGLLGDGEGGLGGNVGLLFFLKRGGKNKKLGK